MNTEETIFRRSEYLHGVEVLINDHNITLPEGVRCEIPLSGEVLKVESVGIGGDYGEYVITIGLAGGGTRTVNEADLALEEARSILCTLYGFWDQSEEEDPYKDVDEFLGYEVS